MEWIEALLWGLSTDARSFGYRNNDSSVERGDLSGMALADFLDELILFLERKSVERDAFRKICERLDEIVRGDPPLFSHEEKYPDRRICKVERRDFSDCVPDRARSAISASSSVATSGITS